MPNNKKKVCVIGLGYVGLPLAVLCALKGYKVFGLDNDRKKIRLINSKKSPIKDKFLEENISKVKIEATSNQAVIKKSDIVIVCVPTPVDKNYYPDLGPVKKAVETIVKNLKKGTLIILESTVNPGVSEEVVEPIFEKAGYKIGKELFIAHCPERINPGKDTISKGYDVRNIPRVVGSFDSRGLHLALKFYRSIINAEITPMKSIREAEAVKIVENSFRDINIAFVNELAKSFDKLGIDIIDVIKGASTKPYAFMPHWPSCGVGGHCIPVDPYYLIERAKESGFDHKFLRVAREINNSMPLYTVELLQDALNEVSLPMKGTGVGILGVAYKADVDDVRQSPSIKIIELVKESLAKAYIFDPYIPEKSNVKNLEELLKYSKAIILVTDHAQFKSLDPKTFNRYGIKVIIDGKNCLDKEGITKLGIIYKGIGR